MHVFRRLFNSSYQTQGAVGHIPYEALRPAACPRDPEILNKTTNHYTWINRFRARKQAVRRKRYQQTLACVVCLFIAGCGFHLRGLIEMPTWFNNVSIIVQNANPNLATLLNSQLKNYRIKQCPNPILADYWIIIEHDNFQQQMVSVSSSTTSRQYQLIYTVSFRLQHAKGQEVLPLRRVVVNRRVTLNSNRILGSTSEEDLSKFEMQQDAVTQMIDILSRAHEH